MCLPTPPGNKACGAVNDSCPQQRIWGSQCRRKFQTQPMFKKPIATGKFPWHPLKNSIKGEKKFPPCNRIRFWTSLIITGGCKLKWQWQIKSRRSEWPFSHVTGNSARASQEEREPTYTVTWEWTLATATRKDSLPVSGEKKTLSRKLSLGSDIPTPGPISRENHHSKTHTHPNTHCSTAYSSQDSDPAKCLLLLLSHFSCVRLCATP